MPKQTDAEKQYKWALREIRQNLPNGEEVAAAVEAWVEATKRLAADDESSRLSIQERWLGSKYR